MVAEDLSLLATIREALHSSLPDLEVLCVPERARVLADVERLTPKVLIVSTAFDQLIVDLRRGFPGIPLVTLVARSLNQSVQKSLQAGAAAAFPRDKLDIGALVETVKRLLAEAEGRERRGEGQATERALLGHSAAMQEVRRLIRVFAPFNSRVLILGETGTGKELVAAELHRQSQRRGLFIGVDCAALPEALLESELFGHARGSFTGAHADKVGLLVHAGGGTLLLDEVNSMPLAIQFKLRRVLEENVVRPVGSNISQPIDVRILAASNESLELCLKQKRFRPDLYYRLNVFSILVPPLRDHPEDIEELVAHFVAEKAREFGKPAPMMTAAAMAALKRRPWPGNVRELEHHLERLVALSGGKIGKEDVEG